MIYRLEAGSACMKCMLWLDCILYFAVIPIKGKKYNTTRQIILQPGRINGRAAGRFAY